jgi:hypothetical protein
MFSILLGFIVIRLDIIPKQSSDGPIIAIQDYYVIT